MIYPTLIGGNCIICNDGTKTQNYITVYEGNKDNNIDFFLIIKDENQKKKHLNLILNNNIWFYLGLINFYYTDEVKVIFNDIGKDIGYFINNCDEKRSKDLYMKKNEYIKNHFNDYLQFIQENNANIERIPKANSISICLSLFNELKNEFMKYSQNQ